jgi:tetratricopeptide (TPR) repeat protein
MDKDVYASGKVGDFFNDKFISVRVQFGKTDQDNEQVKKWYPDAEALGKQYKISTFPTYLFFSPEGEIVRWAVDKKTIADLIGLASAALDPSKQFYTLLKNFRQGKKNYSVMPYLATTASMLGDKKTANEIITDYKNNYVDTLSDDQICSKDLLLLINQFADQFLFPEGSRGKLFAVFYHQGDKVDNAVQWNGFADFKVRWVIGAEEIQSKLWKDDKPLTANPDWGKMRDNIRNEYGSIYADSLVSGAQLDFYKRIGDWREFAKLRDKGLREHPPSASAELFAPNNSYMLNGDAWDVFQHCNDRGVLKKALRWVELAIELDASQPTDEPMDTRANLLYKLGRVEEAIEQEQKALKLGNERAKKNGQEKGGLADQYSANIDKMKKGEPTWPE